MTSLIDYPWHAFEWNRFSLQRQQDRMPHALLISGVEGLGQMQFADQIIARILCADLSSDKACMQCHSCQLFLAGNHPDHIVIEPEEPSKIIKIDQIRTLKDKQELTPAVSKWKTVRVSPADVMNTSASNSLLKLLEEPQANTLLVLVTSKPERLPITIRSRCQSIHLVAPDKPVLTEWLSVQTQADLGSIDELSALANDAPLTILHYLENATLENLNVLDDDIENLITGNANPVLLTKNWLNHDETLLFNYLQLKIKQRISRALAEVSDKNTRLYWHIYDCTINVLKLIASSNNINKTLLIEQFMVSVMNNNDSKLDVKSNKF